MANEINKLRPITIKKYHAIHQRFNHLYNVDRLRYDDCIEKIMEEFYISNRMTVSRIMSTELPNMPQIPVDPNQTTLFDE